MNARSGGVSVRGFFFSCSRDVLIDVLWSSCHDEAMTSHSFAKTHLGVVCHTPGDVQKLTVVRQLLYVGGQQSLVVDVERHQVLLVVDKSRQADNVLTDTIEAVGRLG